MRLKENAMILYTNYLREEILKCLLTTEIFTLALIFKPSTKNLKKINIIIIIIIIIINSLFIEGYTVS